jgi:hypothetical protein
LSKIEINLKIIKFIGDTGRELMVFFEFKLSVFCFSARLILGLFLGEKEFDKILINRS